MAATDKELENQLMEAGNKLLNPPNAVEELLPVLDQVENCLSRVEQSPSQSMLNALGPSMKALVAKELLGHSDTDVKVAVASCVSEITRITAPEAPYTDGLMKEIFQMIVAAFEKLYDMSSTSHLKRVSILETVAKVRSCVVMLDLECDDLILEMFNHFLKAIRDDHPDNIFSSMETIMTLVLEESEDISSDLLHCLLSSVKKENKDILPIARRLGERVIGNCAEKIKPYLMQEVKSLSIALDDYSKIVASTCQESMDDAQENENLNGSGQQSEEESKLSEMTGSESEPPQGADKKEPELACPGEVDPTMDKSPKAVSSNGVVLGGDGNSLDPNSLQKKQDPSDLTRLSEITVAGTEGDTVAGTEGEPDNSDPTKITKPETVQDQATKKTRARKSNSTHSTDNSDHSGMEYKKGVELPSRTRGRSKEADSSVSEGPSIKEATGPSENEKKTEISSPTGSHNETVSAASPDPSQGLPDASRRKRGRPIRKKEVAKADVDMHVSPSGQMETVSSDHIVDEAHQSTNIKLKKDSEGNSDAEVKKRRRSAKQVGVGSANMDEKVRTPDNNSKKESEGLSDSEVKPLRSSGKKVRGGNATEGEVSAKQLKQRRGTPGTEKGVPKEMSRKKTVASTKSATKALTKDESHVEETPKTESKRKRYSMEKATENLNIKDLGEEIVGRKIKVWWPDDKMFYNGTVDSFDPAQKKHKILYEDGDEEILLLKNERWEFISDATDEEKSSELPSPDASEMVPRKKMKASSDLSTKRAKTDSALKRGKGASAEKSKGEDKADDDAPKSRSKSKSEAIKLGGKSKEGTTKTGSKSKDNTSGSKSKDDSPKTTIKLKEETTGKSKDETPKAGSKSVDDSSKMSNKANGASGKGKSGSLKGKEGKGKSASTVAQESDSKSGKKMAQESETKGGKKTAQESETKGGKKTAQETEMKSGKRTAEISEPSSGRKRRGKSQG
ncbi:hypothetical protein AAC387_Pa04g1067 [Persea americana]